MRKFPRNITDTVTSSVYEGTVASLDSAYYSLTAGKLAAASFASSSANVNTSASASDGSGDAAEGSSCLKGSGVACFVDQQLDGFGLERGLFEGNNKRDNFVFNKIDKEHPPAIKDAFNLDDGDECNDQLDGKQSSCLDARLEMALTEGFVNSVAIQMEHPVAGLFIPPSSRNCSKYRFVLTAG